MDYKDFHGFQNINELSKILYSLFGDHEGDIEMEIREALRDMGMNPQVNEILTKGIVRPTLGIDIGSRIGLQVPYVSEILKLATSAKSPLEGTIPRISNDVYCKRIGKCF